MLGGERELLLEAFDSNWIAPAGPQIEDFERAISKRLGIRHAVAVTSGTAAIHLALVAIGVEQGDTVITSSFTFVASANAIRYLKARPVFVDSESRSWNMDPDLLRTALQAQKVKGDRPKAVLVVDVLGQTANYEKIQAICAEYEVPIIEDAAEAVGATYQGQAAGTFGVAGCLSFNGNKIITSGGGGMVVTQDTALAEKIRHLATQACEPAEHYEHSQLGYNYRLSNLLAAVGHAQFQNLDQHLEKRRAIFEKYVEAFRDHAGISFMPRPLHSEPSHWLTVINVDPTLCNTTPEKIRKALKVANIEARPTWKPMHLQPLYSSCEMYGGEVCENIFATGLCLPSGSNLSSEDQDRVTKVIHSLLD